jgi:hypothetical protein
MVRELSAGNAIVQERGFELEQVTCPRCMTSGWLRTHRPRDLSHASRV